MAQKTVDELVIQLTLNAKQLQQSLSSAEQNISKFANKMSSTINTALDLIALKFSVSFGKNLIETFANTGAKLHFLSSQVGESVGTLDKWGVAVQKAGGNADSFYSTISNLHNKLVDMKFSGDMKLASTFGMLGVKTTNADHTLRKTTDILLDLSSVMKGKDTNFQQFVGRQLGIDDATIRVLSQGRDATLKLVNAQKQLYSDKSAAAAEKQREKLIDFERALDKLKIQIAEKLLPAANKFIDWIQKFVNQHGNDLAVIVENIVNGLIKFIDYLPTVTKFFDDLNKTLGITAGDLGKILAGLIGLKVAKDIFGLLTGGATGLANALKLITSPLGAMVTSLATIKWVYDKYEEFKKNPEQFNTDDHSLTNVKGKLGRLFQASEKLGGSLYELFNPDTDINKPKIKPEEYDKTGLNLTTQGNQSTSSSMWNKVIDWAQGKVESENKDSTIGYKQKQDKNGKSHWVDRQGNFIKKSELETKGIPEAYGRYQIMPSTASEVIGRNVTGQELLNGEFNAQVHSKLMDKWTKQYGSKEAALAYYNAGNRGLKQYQETGTTTYLDKIKGVIGGLNPASLASQPVQQAVGQANQRQPTQQAANTTPTIQVNTMNVNADNPKQLASAVQSKVNMAYAFAGNPRIA